jgi:archaellum biogenesis protein FlaJ (TadC family)
MPGLWSVVVGVPIIGLGVYLFTFQTRVDSLAGIPFVVFGAFIIAVGLYVQFIAAPEEPTMREGEEIIDTRTPAQRAALAKVLVSVPVLAVAVYLFYFTFYPYVYPTLALVVGLYLFSTGLYTYWTNTLTVYYVTNKRLIKEYRFVSLIRSELPFDKVRGVQESRSIWETVAGLGDVRVQSGGGGLEISIDNVYDSTEFADLIRKQM